MVYLKSTLLILLLFVVGKIEAQETNTYNDNDGVFKPWTIGGSFNFNTGNFNSFYLFTTVESFVDVEKSTRFGINPALSYRFNERLGANIFLGYGRIHQEGKAIILQLPVPIQGISGRAAEATQN